ncbi:MAG TPA: BTAD domain-containing putative transcriptional regulator [Gemmatimonadaceae bacterium]|nr:BTAD domain-containing putative transcriptional regulator [Gemmatimonadaceae bacterium]
MSVRGRGATDHPLGIEEGGGFRLITLGRLALLAQGGEADESLGKRRRKLALLAVLAMASRPYSRDVLADMFWGEEDDERARHSLSDALSHLRRTLGREAITSRQAEVGLTREIALRVDALDFAAACKAGDHARAIALYGGPFLDGVYVEASRRFEEWIASERRRLADLFVHACRERCIELARARGWSECHAVAQRWLTTSPLSVDAALYLINASKASGTRESAVAALNEYDALAALLARDYESKPDGRVTALAAALRARIESGVAGDVERPFPRAQSEPRQPDDSSGTIAAGSAVPDGFAAPPSPRASRDRPAHSARRRTLAAVAAAAASLVLLGAGTFLAGRRAAADSPPRAAAVAGRPVVAVTLVQNVRGDSSLTWLQDGLKQMISADLSRSPAVEVVAPSRVRDVAARMEPGDEGQLSTLDAMRIARGVGATWAVTGGITRGDGVYVMDAGVRDVATGRLLRLFTVTGTDILAVADQVSSRILATAESGKPGPRLSDIETANVGAYQHFVRSIQAGYEGRFADQVRELDDAIAADSGFVSAIVARLRVARVQGDESVVPRLTRLFDAARGRASDWDIAVQELYTAFHDGERRRSERLARALVSDHPHDPRAYDWLARVYMSHGEWDAADTVFQRELSLDSLALSAGNGPCASCAALAGLSWLRLYSGQLPAGERAARRWVALQPDVPASWSMLSTALAYAGRYDSAIVAGRRAELLAQGGAAYEMRLGRILVMERRFYAADSAAAAWSTRPGDDFHADALELREIVLRERGRLRAADRVIAEAVAHYPEAASLSLTRANDLARLGDVHGAVRIYETGSHPRPVQSAESVPLAPLHGDGARAFCWAHALEADALAARGDTTHLRALADSIEVVSMRSYYGRDWRLAHHVRGLIAMRSGRYADAAREFRQAMWGANGWTMTNERLAIAELRLGRADEAIAALRQAYEAPPDAMGRYAVRSELDLYMALAFRAEGKPDSSTVYTGYVRHAWAHADPEVKAKLRALTSSATSSATSSGG